MTRRRPALAGLLAVALLAGCMTVRIQARDGEVRTLRHFGVLQIQLAKPEQAIVGSITGLGLVGAPLGLSLGYTRQHWALLGPECRTVVWLDSEELSERSGQMLARTAGVCLLAPQGLTASTVDSNKPKDITP